MTDLEELHLHLAAHFDLLADLLAHHPAVSDLVARGEHEKAARWRGKITDMLVGAVR